MYLHITLFVKAIAFTNSLHTIQNAKTQLFVKLVLFTKLSTVQRKTLFINFVTYWQLLNPFSTFPNVAQSKNSSHTFKLKLLVQNHNSYLTSFVTKLNHHKCALITMLWVFVSFSQYLLSLLIVFIYFQRLQTAFNSCDMFISCKH